MSRKTDSEESNYGRKKKWRATNCGNAPLCCFPEVMVIASHMKPWK